MIFGNLQTQEVWDRIAMTPGAYENWIEVATMTRLEDHARSPREIMAGLLQAAWDRAVGMENTSVLIDWRALADRFLDDSKSPKPL